MPDWRLLRYSDTTALRRIHDRLHRLYGDAGAGCFARLAMMIGRYGVGENALRPHEYWSERDAVLITYGDMVSNDREEPLTTLRRFLIDWLQRAVSTVHILPFFPYSSDDGFSVIDYRAVNPDLGKWAHIAQIGGEFKLMVDLVLNHCSRRSEWFKDYVDHVAPGRHYFIESDPQWDLSPVVRPRNLPLLTQVDTRLGQRHVWTTFSDDQIDLNFQNYHVLFEFLDILLFYLSQGARAIRLDAIAYLWKQLGTSCIHLPQTHEIVKLIRDFFEIVAPDALIITETNVPHEENISYFGQGDEAHVVYQFTLPPLLLHALQTGNARYLTRWARRLAPPPPGGTFLNFTASHDGIGVRPVEGILPAGAVRSVVDAAKRRGGQVSVKRNADGSESPYELNITYVDALADPENPDEELHIRRFLCSQAVALALQGIPAIYFNSLVAGRNDYQGVEDTGHPRAINRHKWREDDLGRQLADPDGMPGRVFNEYLRLLRIRAQQVAFHPDGPQTVLSGNPSLFTVIRQSPDGNETILAVHNFKAGRSRLQLTPDERNLLPDTAAVDLLDDRRSVNLAGTVTLKPYQVMWLCFDGE